MVEEDGLMSSNAEIEAELKRIEDEIDAEPGFIDIGRIGQGMVILGTIAFATYFALTLLSTAVLASDSWGVFNFWSINRFLAVSVFSLFMIILGYIMAKGSGYSIGSSQDN